MELGLSLGGDSTTTARKPFGFPISNGNGPLKHPRNNDNKKGIENSGLGLGFCMALGTNSNDVHVQRVDHRADADDDDEEEDGEDDQTSSEHTRDDPLQLDLLPRAPVPRRWSSENGSSGSSGNVGVQPVAATTRGFDVNRMPPAGVGAAAAEEVSSPNSVASSFQMDFSIFRGSGSLINNGGNRRDLGGAAGNDIVEVERASSRASDEDENGLNGRKKLRLSKEQSAYLEESFKEHNTLNPKQKLALAKQLNLRPRQVEVWFQNRRARTKLKQTEVDCEYLKRCCETLTEENRRLHKELQELRALKTSNPFYMQLPATTLTMCPSCERVATTSSSAPPSTTTTTTAIATATPAAVTTTTTTNTTTTDSTPKAIQFPISRPRFYPFAHKTNQPHQSAAS